MVTGGCLADTASGVTKGVHSQGDSCLIPGSGEDGWRERSLTPDRARRRQDHAVSGENEFQLRHLLSFQFFVDSNLTLYKDLRNYMDTQNTLVADSTEGLNKVGSFFSRLITFFLCNFFLCWPDLFQLCNLTRNWRVTCFADQRKRRLCFHMG